MTKSLFKELRKQLNDPQLGSASFDLGDLKPKGKNAGKPFCLQDYTAARQFLLLRLKDGCSLLLHWYNESSPTLVSKPADFPSDYLARPLEEVMLYAQGKVPKHLTSASD